MRESNYFTIGFALPKDDFFVRGYGNKGVV
jgi:hypothetical protein